MYIKRHIEESAAFLQLNPPPVFIDEVQYTPEIFSYIKMSLDKSRHKGDYFLIGSQSMMFFEFSYSFPRGV